MDTCKHMAVRPRPFLNRLQEILAYDRMKLKIDKNIGKYIIFGIYFQKALTIYCNKELLFIAL